MLTILVVAAPGFPDILATHPSLELLHAHDSEDALEKLGRNRRIDAVLLAGWDPGAGAEIADAIRDDNPAPPPLYSLGIPLPGTTTLAPPLEGALEALERDLTVES